MKKFKQCCLCFDLRSGVKIISILWILYAVLSIVLPLGINVEREEKDNSALSANVTGNSNSTIIQNDNDDDDDDDDEKNSFFDIDYLIIAFSILEIILSILLYVGAAKDKHKLMLPWLIVTMLEIMYTFVHSIIILFGLFILSLNSIAFAYIIFIIFVFPFQLYLWFCVYSLYYKLKHEIISAV